MHPVHWSYVHELVTKVFATCNWWCEPRIIEEANSRRRSHGRERSPRGMASALHYGTIKLTSSAYYACALGARNDHAHASDAPYSRRSNHGGIVTLMGESHVRGSFCLWLRNGMIDAQMPCVGVQHRLSAKRTIQREENAMYHMVSKASNLRSEMVQLRSGAPVTKMCRLFQFQENWCS